MVAVAKANDEAKEIKRYTITCSTGNNSIFDTRHEHAPQRTPPFQKITDDQPYTHHYYFGWCWTGRRYASFFWASLGGLVSN
jgi:hypothetical protein